MGTLVVTTLACLLHFGGWPHTHTVVEALQQVPISFVLFLSGLVTLTVTTSYYLWRGLLAGALAAVAWRGLRLMFPVCVILLYSWTLGSLLREELHVGQWLASLLAGRVSLSLMPLLLFWNGALISLALGSSWATAAILVPIALPMVMAMDGIAAPALPEQLPILCPMMGAILSGAVCGDHISLISETTAMAATSTGCGHMGHVKTQAPYALPIVIGASAGFLVVGYIGGGALASILVSITVSGACSFAAHYLSRHRTVPAIER